MSKITVEQYQSLADEHIPFASMMGLQLESIDNGGIWMRARYDEKFLRPGGTISGPVMMGLADAAVYALVLSRVGLVDLAVTTSLNINFLRKPLPGDILARAAPLKLGKRLVIAEVAIYSAEDIDPAQNVAADMVAHATATYSIPPQQH